jgi:pilus assembly protein CpaE
MRVFLIDDEKLYYKLLNPLIKKAGHELGYASSGKGGLKKIAAFDPDVIILDIQLGDMTGFDVLERLHNDTHFSHVPVIFVTSFDELENKLKAFTLGAEDYLTKPFNPEELLARLEILARRRDYLKISESIVSEKTNISTVVALHSLRGGVGCTSLAINLALAYYRIWLRPSMLIDAVLTSGQVALLLNASPKTTWKDVANVRMSDLDGDMMRSLENMHKSGISFLSSPKLPTTFEDLNELFPRVLNECRGHHDFLVIDTPHDFSDVTIMSLDAADHILLVLAPEMASFRAALCALATYDRLGYPQEKIKVVLNHPSGVYGFKIQQVEKAIGRKVDIEFPFSPEVNQAINTGEPFLIANPNLQISKRIEEFAYNLSRDALTKVPPAIPTSTWKNINKRLKNTKRFFL